MASPALAGGTQESLPVFLSEHHHVPLIDGPAPEGVPQRTDEQTDREGSSNGSLEAGLGTDEVI